MTGRTQIGKPAVLRQVPDRRRVLSRATIEYVGQSSVRSVPPRQTRTESSSGSFCAPPFWGRRCLLHLNAGFGPLTVRG